MKKLLTLATLGALSALSLNAQAQASAVTVDGVLNAAEINSTNYVLVGKYTNPRGFGDAGLLSLYAAASTNKVYLFLAGTVEPNGNAFQMYFKLPGSTGVPVGTSLPAGSSGTSFAGMTAKMEFPVSSALALRGAAAVAPATTPTFYVEGAAYTTATTAASAKLNATNFAGDGSAQTLPTNAAYPAFNGARVAYRNTTDNKIQSNPGYNASSTNAAYGGAGSYGWEIEIDRTAAGLTGATSLTAFALQNNGGGDFLSTDFIPQATSGASSTGTNLGGAGAVDFRTITGLQYAVLNMSATGATTLGAKTSANELALGVFPNPTADRTSVSYVVGTSSTPVQVSLLDLMGRTVRVVESGVKAAGQQTTSLSTNDLAAGTYLVRVQVGDNVATSKVSVL